MNSKNITVSTFIFELWTPHDWANAVARELRNLQLGDAIVRYGNMVHFHAWNITDKEADALLVALTLIMRAKFDKKVRVALIQK